jgi:hypothetical protein
MSGAQRQARYMTKLRKAAARKRALSPSPNGPSHDMVQTPSALAKAIVQHFAPTGVCLDPCRDSGAFWRALKACPGVTDVLWCELSQGLEFMEFDGRVDSCVSNPPWSRMRQFLRHGMEIADNVVYLATMNHFDTRALLQDIRESGFGIREALLLPHPPPPWPRSGFQLAAVHLQRGWSGG